MMLLLYIRSSVSSCLSRPVPLPLPSNFSIGRLLFKEHRNAKHLIVRQLATNGQLTTRLSLHKCSRISRWLQHSYRLQSAVQIGQTIQRNWVKFLVRHRPSILLSAVCLLERYDFDSNGITDASLDRYREDNHIDRISGLIDGTVTCPVCEKRLVLQQRVPGVEYCECGDRDGADVWSRSWEGWHPFIEQSNILVWRRQHQELPHLFLYKVYGRYDDVSLCAFAETQLNSSYRHTWDPSALELRVLCRDGANNGDDRDSMQNLLYWLVKFPRFFANRDYVFRQRYRADRAHRELVIVNEAIGDEGAVPAVAGVHRVHDYWSVMVLRSTNEDMEKPGLEYTLTYFDNPGTSLPASITNYVASTEFPNFLQHVHSASVTLQRQHEAGKEVYTNVPRSLFSSQRKSLLAPEIETSSTLSNVNDELKVSQTKQLYDEDSHGIKAIRDVENSCITQTSVDNTSDIKSIMEALGEMTSLEDGELLQKLNATINDKIDSLDDNVVLFAKLKSLKHKLENFRLEGREKKDKSLSIMKEFERSHNRYGEHEHHTAPEMVQQLFDSMNDILKADLEMRTGKGLLQADACTTLVQTFIDRNSSSNNASSSRSPVISRDNSQDNCMATTNVQPQSKCEPSEESHDSSSEDIKSSDSCDKSSDPPPPSSSSSWSGWLYSVFVEKPASLFTPSPKSPEPKVKESTDERKVKSTESKVKTSEKGEIPDPSGDPSCPQQSRKSATSMWYYVYGWLLWPSVDACGEASSDASPTLGDRTKRKNVEETCSKLYNSSISSTDLNTNEQGNKNLEPCDNNSRVSWYWMPISASWKYGVWLVSLVVKL